MNRPWQKNIANLSPDEEKYKDKVWFEIESLINCYIELTPEQLIALDVVV